MSKETLITGQKSLRQTMAQTGKVLFGKQVPNYTLYFIDPTKTRRAGEHTTIVNPYIELGRASNNVVQYGEEFPTVSRKHASIAFENGQVVVVSLGKNPTYVNGQEVQGKRILNNGDEIQLSSNGPRIRFNATPTNTSNMKFTQRMGLMAEQALKPYKQLVTALFILLLLAIGSGVWYGMETNNKLGIASGNLKKMKQKTDSLDNQLVKNNAKLKANEAKLVKMENNKETQSDEYKKLKAYTYKLRKDVAKTHKELSKLKSKSELSNRETSVLVESGGSEETASEEPRVITFDDLPSMDVYFTGATKVDIAFPGQKLIEYKASEKGQHFLYTGTAFLTKDHKLISARHVFQPYRFSQEGDVYSIIALYEAMGANITVYFEAIRKDGNLSFHFTDKNIRYDDSQDKTVTIQSKGEYYPYKKAVYGPSDWAYITLDNLTGEIEYSRELSKSLRMGEKLHAIGYSYGALLQPSQGDLIPLYSSATVAQNGLVNGVINVTNRGFGSGHSGGPVFKYVNGKFIVVGLVSAGIGSEIGIIVPVANLR